MCLSSVTVKGDGGGCSKDSVCASPESGKHFTFTHHDELKHKNGANLFLKCAEKSSHFASMSISKGLLKSSKKG